MLKMKWGWGEESVGLEHWRHFLFCSAPFFFESQEEGGRVVEEDAPTNLLPGPACWFSSWWLCRKMSLCVLDASVLNKRVVFVIWDMSVHRLMNVLLKQF